MARERMLVNGEYETVVAGHGMARLGAARHGMARLGAARVQSTTNNQRRSKLCQQ